jgi:hypothetical protein
MPCNMSKVFGIDGANPYYGLDKQNSSDYAWLTLANIQGITHASQHA